MAEIRALLDMPGQKSRNCGAVDEIAAPRGAYRNRNGSFSGYAPTTLIGPVDLRSNIAGTGCDRPGLGHQRR
ncbi:hypothetical protein, partial [Novosphingobium sp.]|uniref:hypothetical protein n=1 Tax=Novosphingobium sp. TaxID=1874826 RepID=UPI003FA5E575